MHTSHAIATQQTGEVSRHITRIQVSCIAQMFELYRKECMPATPTVLYPLQVWGESQSAGRVVHVLGVVEGVY